MALRLPHMAVLLLRTLPSSPLVPAGCKRGECEKGGPAGIRDGTLSSADGSSDVSLMSTEPVPGADTNILS